MHDRNDQWTFFATDTTVCLYGTAQYPLPQPGDLVDATWREPTQAERALYESTVALDSMYEHIRTHADGSTDVLPMIEPDTDEIKTPPPHRI